jgi:hypothetical protein
MIRRQKEPTARLVQSAALLEFLLLSVQPLGYAGRAVKGLPALIRTRKAFFGNIDDLLAACAIRNHFAHGGDRGQSPSLAEADHAASIMMNAIEALRPHLSPANAALVEYDPHEPIPAPATDQALSSPSPFRRVMGLHLRLESLLCKIDEQNCLAAYDLAPGEDRPSPSNRLKRHAGLFDASLKASLGGALNWVAKHKGKEATADFEAYHRNRLSQIEASLLEAIAVLEGHLGILSPVPTKPAITIPEAAISPDVTTELPVTVTGPEPQPAVECVAPLEPVVEIASEADDEETETQLPDPQSSIVEDLPLTPARVSPADMKVRIRIPAQTLLLAKRVLAATAATLLLAGVIAFEGNTSVAATGKLNRASAGAAGTESLILTVDEQGAVTEIEIPHALGCRLDSNAIATVSELRFGGPSRQIRTKLPCQANSR